VALHRVDDGRILVDVVHRDAHQMASCPYRAGHLFPRVTAGGEHVGTLGVVTDTRDVWSDQHEVRITAGRRKVRIPARRSSG
jgi:hypothetical protein